MNQQIELKVQILNIFKKNINKLYNCKQIASILQIKDTFKKEKLIYELNNLCRENKLKEVEIGKFKLKHKEKKYTGILNVNSNGNAFFICDYFNEDIFVSQSNLGKALDQDTVEVHVYRKGNKKKLEAEVVRIVKRKRHKFIGILQIEDKYTFVVPQNNKIHLDIFISKSKLNGAKHGNKVLVKIIDWPDNLKNPNGEIIKVLGVPGEHETEINSIILEYGLHSSFPKYIEEEANSVKSFIDEEEIKKRRDIRTDLCFTIDPKDAKDFDDALSFNKLSNGNYQIGIHIADVSHFVKPNSKLNDEAYQRATSVYLVDRVIPMLPEFISNNLCSLNPNEDKLCFSAVFELTKQATLVNQWFGKTIINSNKRFSYEEAQYILDTQNAVIPATVALTNKKYRVDQAVVEALLKLNILAKILRKKRIKEGAISFDKNEISFCLDESANPTKVYLKQAKEAHNLIEEFMLLTNKKVAEFIGINQGRATRNTFVYRVHDQPDELKLASLKSIVSKFGYKINTKNKIKTSQSINKLLEDINGKKEANMLETLVIRSMSKAHYTTENIGHYGLAFNYYSHFTSPIRRYPDLITHRLLLHYLKGGNSPKATTYEIACKHSSKMEEVAVKAERESIKYMQVKYMKKFIDKQFKGLVSGVTEWGIYVEIIANKCEGMVRIKDIKNDFFIFDEKQYAIIGKRTKKKIQLGDEVQIRVKKADLERKHLDFKLIKY
ncbi:MAG: ribonuclease R [Tenacibaculum sp.]